MSKLIKDGALTNDQWTLLKEATGAEVLDVIPGKNLLVPLNFWLENQEEIAQYTGGMSIWLESDQVIDPVKDGLEQFPIIALNFPVFSDGRSYSNARQIRSELGYSGELRAIGDVLRDQIYYMSQCGFNSFSLRHDQDPELCIQAFNDFTTSYQATVVEPLPLFRRR